MPHEHKYGDPVDVSAHGHHNLKGFVAKNHEDGTATVSVLMPHGGWEVHHLKHVDDAVEGEHCFYMVGAEPHAAKKAHHRKKAD